MNIIVNGERRVVANDATLTQALETINVEAARVAVAVNQTFVPREHHGQHRLRAGDRLDLITRIAGG